MGRIIVRDLNQLTGVIRRDDQTCDGIDQAKDEVSKCEPSNINHSPSQCRLDNAIAHAYNEQKEERERISASVENCYHHHEDFGAHVGAISVEEVCGQILAQRCDKMSIVG
jgi:hypothetical protein